jgi:CTP:molybdopterin cytidylyltransferase MocA
MRLAAVVLAAGGSARLGRPKQLLEIGGETLVRRAARLALEAGFDPVLVVLGAQAREIAQALEGLALTILENRGWEEGLASSIRAGVAALPQSVEGAAFLLCDQPALELGVLRDLRRTFEADPSRPAGCAYAASVGIPALFPRSYFQALAELGGDKGAKGLLREASLVAFPAGQTDLDTPEDVEGWLRR